MHQQHTCSTLVPYTSLFRSPRHVVALIASEYAGALAQHIEGGAAGRVYALLPARGDGDQAATVAAARALAARLQRHRSEEHTSELQSQFHLVCRLLLEKKKQ